MLSSNWFTRAAVILSGLWIACVYLWFAAQPRFGASLVAYGVLPALLFGGGVWVWSDYRASKGSAAQAASSGSALEQPGTPATKPAAATSRLWARYTDIGLSTSLASLMAAVFLPSEFLAYRLDAPSHNAAILVFVPLFVALGFVLEGLSYQCFGTTPAKALLGLRVLTRDGATLSADQYWRRNGGVLAMGYGFGVPFIAWLPMLYNGRRLANTGYTAWDAKWGYQVVQRPCAAWRVAVFYILFFMVQYLTYWEHFKSAPSNAEHPAFDAPVHSESVAVLASTQPEAVQPVAALSAASSSAPLISQEQLAAMQVYSEKVRFSQHLQWLNPITGLPARVPNEWAKILPDDANKSWSFFRVLEDENRADIATFSFYPRREHQGLRDFVRLYFAKAAIPVDLKERMTGNRLVIFFARDDKLKDGAPYFADAEFWESREGFWHLQFGSTEKPNYFNIFDAKEMADLLMASTTP